MLIRVCETRPRLFWFGLASSKEEVLEGFLCAVVRESFDNEAKLLYLEDSVAVNMNAIADIQVLGSYADPEYCLQYPR